MSLLLRIVLALGVVLLLMWVIARASRRSLLARSKSEVVVIARAPLTKQASVSVVRLVDRALLIGVTDSHVSLLAELTGEEIGVLDRTGVEDRTVIDLPASALPGTALPATALPATALPATALPAAGSPVSGFSASGSVAPVPGGRLAGSALSPATWRQAIVAVQERTARRG